ncbi:CsgG/HfaB family protein [Lutibacter flavus]|uniref:Curli production assembly/transport component CsgG n=1 Tax=Lutibacter flavus TaxID=691689 RepID=A0A238ZMP9_9FLAO|nr:CsgG/HfaB family protein [Lutibacter flavus]SNR84409.1 curli production assembly/transport component CsgG [Lutibacter flavus]
MRKYFKFIICSFLVVLTSCGTFFNQPFKTSKARIGENTTKKSFLDTILPLTETIVGVYKFRDQTGQYKMVENGSTFSTAVTQGGTSMLLKSLEESKWFKPIERENIGNLLNERQIIRSTRQEYAKDANQDQTTSIPPLLFAGIILEGGVVSYDSNIITGGSGARYFGVGGSTEYRQDRITIYLRAVSTSSGRILKNVYVSKTILSQGISANLFRYVDVKRLLEVETGVTKNEPTQLAVKEAIDKAVELLIIEGIIDGLWAPAGGEPIVNLVKEKFENEKEDAGTTALYDRKLEDKRGTFAFNMEGASTVVSDDYPNSEKKLGGNVSMKFYFKKPGLNLNIGAGYFQLENKEAFKNKFLSADLNLGYDLLPYDKLSPFVYAGVGAVVSDKELKDNYFKFQYGGGIEYLPVKNIGIKVFAEQNLMFTDKIEGLVAGKWNDYYLRFGLGLNFYLGQPYKSVKQVMFE